MCVGHFVSSTSYELETLVFLVLLLNLLEERGFVQ